MRQREAAKAAELGVGARTVARMRARYAGQGLWGLVNQRDVAALAGVGRADARLVAAAREVITAETDDLDRHPVAADPPGDQAGGGRPRPGRGAAAGQDHASTG